MSRHRDVRCMNYSDEYDGYDDVYGHSVEDDYCVSPGAEQFMYDRNKQANISSFITEPNIAEDNEEELEEQPASYKTPSLSELDNAKLMSCVDSIRNVIGDSITESELKKRIIELDYNTEAVLDAILNSASSKKVEEQTPNKRHSDFPSGNKQTPKPASQLAKPAIKIVPAATRSIVKGFDVSGSENSEFLNSRIASPRSQSPSSERNSPDIRHPSFKERKSGFSKSSTPRCQSPISGTTSPEPESRNKTAEEKRDALAIYKNKRGESKEQLHLVVVGHVDAGKSTLLGRLLCDLGQVSSKLIHKYQQESKKIGKQSFAYAWVLDETGEERERGITMDVGHSKFETSTKCITLLDAPGHKDFIPNMITGATQADVALLVVDATRGEFETGFESGGQTREHAILLRSLGVSQLAVVVNKLDTVEWSKERFNEIVNKMSNFLKQVGFRDTVTFVPASGLSGENIVSKPKEALASWYNGPTLIDVIDNFKCPERPIDKPLRFSVNDIFKGTGSGFCIFGPVETGLVSTGDKVVVLPQNEIANVKGIQIDESPVTHAFAGDQISLVLSGVDQQNIAIGDIVSSVYNPIPVTSCFQAHIVIFTITNPITKGLPVVIHLQSLIEPAVITRLIAQLHRSTGEVVKKKPRCLPKNSSAIVEIATQRPICMELYRDIKQLGRVMLRVQGTTVAAGLITKIK